MTNAQLIEELAAQVRDCLKGIKLPVEYQRAESEEVPVNVFVNYLPEELFEDSNYYPCVIVELVEVEDDLKSGSVVEVAMTIGTFALEADAWKDAWHLLETIRRRLLSKRLIARRFRLESLKWTTPPEQPRQFYFLLGELKYSTYLPQEEV